MNSLVGLPGNIIQYAVGDINRAYIVGNVKFWHVFLAIAVNNVINCAVISVFILITAPIFFHVVLPASMGYFIGTLFVCIILSTLIGILIGMVCKSESISVIVAQCLFLPSIFLSGIMVYVSILPKAMRTISNIFPLTHMFVFTDAIKQLSVIYIACALVVCTVIVVYRYKKIIVSQ